jgi:hypothetical protein
MIRLIAAAPRASPVFSFFDFLVLPLNKNLINKKSRQKRRLKNMRKILIFLM